MSQDGWSNIHNESIICLSITDAVEENIHLINTIDSQEYILDLSVNAIKRCQELGCSVRSFVTNNVSNMTKMRTELSKNEELSFPDIITYGCSAHILNLLAQDAEIPEVKKDTVSII
jgi:hypothetical protein